jgi:hypothetical protein
MPNLKKRVFKLAYPINIAHRFPKICDYRHNFFRVVSLLKTLVLHNISKFVYNLENHQILMLYEFSNGWEYSETPRKFHFILIDRYEWYPVVSYYTTQDTWFYFFFNLTLLFVHQWWSLINLTKNQFHYSSQNFLNTDK